MAMASPGSYQEINPVLDFGWACSDVTLGQSPCDHDTGRPCDFEDGDAHCSPHSRCLPAPKTRARAIARPGATTTILGIEPQAGDRVTPETFSLAQSRWPARGAPPHQEPLPHVLEETTSRSHKMPHRWSVAISTAQPRSRWRANKGNRGTKNVSEFCAS